MLSTSPTHRIFLAIAPLDFRCGIDAIVKLCQQQLRQDPSNGQYFIFRNRRSTSIKVLYYDSQGYCLWQKRLSAGKFKSWPKSTTQAVTLTPAQTQVLLFNGDPTNTQEEQPWRQLA